MHGGVVTLGGYRLLSLSWLYRLSYSAESPHLNDLRVPTNAQERLRIDYYLVSMSKNPLGFCYESSTSFSNRELVI